MSLALLFAGIASVAYGLTADTGSLTLTGRDTSFGIGRPLVASTGTFTVEGIAATVSANRNLTIDSASVALTGTATGFTVAKRLALDTGAFALTGQDNSFATALSFNAELGTYECQAIDADLAFVRGIQSLTLPADTGVFLATGPNAILRGSYRTPLSRVSVFNRIQRPAIARPNRSIHVRRARER